jgi:hypothetical protein
MSEEQIAFHEAGHAVVAVVMHVPFEVAALCKGEGGYVGAQLSPEERRTMFRSSATFATQDVVRTRASLRHIRGGVVAEMITTAAGPVQNALMGLNPNLAAHDLMELEKYAEAVIGRPAFRSMRGYDPEHRRFRAWIDLQAETILMNTERWVARTAAALQRHRVLTAGHIQKLQHDRGVITR